MKRILLLLAALATLAPRLLADATDYTSFIVQKQDGFTWYTNNIAATGTGTSKSAITETGSAFQLWTIHNTKGTEYLLDTKIVGAYGPKGDIAVTTSDPTGDKWGVKRTRIDKPFTVKSTVSGLLSGADVAEADKKVLLAQHLGLYPSGASSLVAATVLSSTPVTTAYITTNGTSTLNYAKSSLYVVSPTTASGEEHFVLHALAIETRPQTQLDSDFVQVWPLATATITGVTSGTVITGKMPDLTISYTNLYPYSTSRVIIYPAGNRPAAKELPGSSLTWDDKTNKSHTATVSNYDALIPADGSYTLEAVTTTPFATDETLTKTGVTSAGDTITFTSDRTMKVRAMQVGASD